MNQAPTPKYMDLVNQSLDKKKGGLDKSSSYKLNPYTDII